MAEPSACSVHVGGEALVDLVLRQDSTTAVLGGGPFNTARTIARLGGHAGFVGAISTDGFGRRLMAALCEDGVDASSVQRTDAPTTLALAEIDETGSATYHFYFADTSAPSLTEVPSDPPDAVHVGTLGLVLEPMASTLLDWVLGQPDDVLVMVDANSRPSATADPAAYVQRLRRVCARAEVLKVSVEDLAFVARHAPEIEADGPASLLDWGVKVVLLTDGGDGVTVLTSTGFFHVAAVPVDVMDTIGAGDSFGGGFLLRWLELGRDESSLREAVEFASRVAAITCTRAGADPPFRSEL